MNASANTTTPTNGTSGSTQYQSYQDYYQSYMMQLMYGNYSAYYANMMNPTGTTQQNQTNAQPPPPPPPPPPPKAPESNAHQSQEPQQNKTAPIKFNLKFQQQPQQQPKLLVPSVKPQESTTPGRKSRFDMPPLSSSSSSTSNVIKQQNLYQQYQQKQKEKLATEAAAKSQPTTTTTTTTTNPNPTTPTYGDDIISDINKWPVSLKNYCSRLFTIYHSNKLVSEQQVTRYLQTRITETFKIKNDLNINWDNEKIPDVQTIRQLTTTFTIGTIESQNQKQQYNQVPPPTETQTPPKSLLSIETTKPKTPFQQRMLNQKLKQQAQQQQQVSNNKRKSKSKSPSSDKSSTASGSTSSSSITLSTKKLRKERQQQHARVVTSKFKRNLSDDEEEDDENESNEESEEDFKPLTKKQQKIMNKKAKNMKIEIKNNFVDQKSFNNRMQRFQSEKKKFVRKIELFEKETNNLVNNCIVGTSKDLEKEYLRLTGEPEPANVRPLNVLKQSLDYILDKYSTSKDYRYVCDQLKAIRQDLTVQMIRNDFTIQVYETHVRLAIVTGDRDSLNQCQSQLKSLYETVANGNENEAEFIGYRLLYYILTKSYKDLNRIIIEIKRKYNENEYLKHLIKFRTAWHMNNYVMLFKLYKKSNQMSKYLIDLFIERERKLALKMIIKSYRPHIKLEIVKELLVYESINKCKEDLLSYGLCIQSELDENQKQILILDCKSSNIQNL